MGKAHHNFARVGAGPPGAGAPAAELEHGSQEESPDGIDFEKMFRFLKLKWAILVKF